MRFLGLVSYRIQNPFQYFLGSYSTIHSYVYSILSVVGSIRCKFPLTKLTVTLRRRKHKDLYVHSNAFAVIIFLAEMPAKPSQHVHFLLALAVSTRSSQVIIFDSSSLFFLSQAPELKFPAHILCCR